MMNEVKFEGKAFSFDGDAFYLPVQVSFCLQQLISSEELTNTVSWNKQIILK